MCRHLAYLGPAVPIKTLVSDPPYGLLRQSWTPRRQRSGTLNADGFGIGWYVEDDPVPARYWRGIPMWSDESFADLARVTRTRALLAAVRSASAGMAPEAAAAAPYRDGPWLFSHNGRVEGWPGSMARLAASLPAEALLEMEARVDSALLWALVLHRLRAGTPPGVALETTVAEAAAAATGRYNFLLTDGRTIAATTYGDSLTYRTGDGSVLVASEEADEDGGWIDVPDRSLLVATEHEVTITPLPLPAELVPSARSAPARTEIR